MKKAKAVSETENKQNPIQIQSVSKDELEKVTAAGTIFLPYQFTFSIKVSTNPDTAQRFAPGASTLVIYSNATSYESSPSNTYWIDVFKVGSSSPIGRAYFTRKGIRIIIWKTSIIYIVFYPRESDNRVESFLYGFSLNYTLHYKTNNAILHIYHVMHDTL
ncbi:hypothetical protein [Aneurinibacillus danicus]|uniref:Uncharacterized protein n=1 Tax=Aneurinibacillus danicus TaxID=267746 RepID=A0A511V2E5_9BACL|nr:hypothetical protein [Aneurinibacillus danicus]GEN33086.1 hypothetical protein ADA01nite_05460 [Aneurinibacillus danicus]